MAAWRQDAAANEAPAFKVDKGPVPVGEVEVRTKRPRRRSFLVAEAPHGGRQRTRCCLAANLLFSPLTLPMASSGGRAFKVDEGPVLVDEVEVRTKRP